MCQSSQPTNIATAAIAQILGCLLVFFPQVSTDAQQISGDTSKRTLVDGAKNPELIPEWFRWERLFRSLEDFAQSPESRMAQYAKETLPLPEREMALLRLAAQEHRASERRLAERIKTTIDQFDRNGRSPQQVQEELFKLMSDLDMEYRYDILKARTDLHKRLSPESVQELNIWIEQHIVMTTKVMLDPRDAGRFRLPW